MKNFFCRLLSLDLRELLPGKNLATDPSARDHPSGFLLALKDAGRNGFSKLPLYGVITWEKGISGQKD